MTIGVPIPQQQTSGLSRTGDPWRSTWRLTASKPVSYDVILGTGVLDVGNPTLARAGAPGSTSTGSRRLVVMERRVQELYGEAVSRYFEAHGVESQTCLLDGGEKTKSLDAALMITAAMDRFGISRRSEPVIAIGGGVLTDIVGFAASLYRRSTPYVRVPTTLIGMVDAAIGAKTGVNHDGHKNRLGTYHPAVVTLIDWMFLRTLDRRHVVNGLAEVLKLAMVSDSMLFELLARHGCRLIEQRLQPAFGVEYGDVGVAVLCRAVHGMLAELQPNLWESRLRRRVDYGHSFSPSLEMRALPELLHGEAVAIDMALCTVLARRRGLIGESDERRIFAVLADLELPVWHRVCRSELILAALAEMVRHRDGRQRLPLLTGIGQVCFVNDVTERELLAALTELRQRATVSSECTA
ncbi:sedoheptulose 7-phosphate cyclase [Micromonospora sp. WMMD723]|uniref:sedoheptulose 7-phosphate cyclase n=1 Tax=unclassified Micromonospora TaxID=2617518 RepID=UPI003B925BC4